MQDGSGQRRRALWPLLFPVTLLGHLAEEYWGGEGFPAWASRLADINLTPGAFLSINIPFLFVMTGVVLYSIATSSARWFLAALGALVLVNGLLHSLMSVLTGTYSPGMVTGLLLWIPLGLFALARLRRELSAFEFGGGVVLGVAIHALATATALSIG